MKTNLRKTVCSRRPSVATSTSSFRGCGGLTTQFVFTRKLQEEASQLETRNAHLRDIQKELAGKKEKIEALIAGLIIDRQEKIS